MESDKVLKERVENFIAHGGTLDQFAQLYVENGEGTIDDFLDAYVAEVVNDNISGGSIFDRIGRGIESIWKTITGFFVELLNILNPASDKFFLKQFFDGLSVLFKNIGNALASIGQAIAGIAEAVGNAIGEVLKALFIPKQESIDNLVNSVTSKFGFVDTVKNGIAEIQTMVTNNENLPTMAINLPQNQWYNGQVTVIDLNWYSTYKPYGDLIIAAFIYVFFAWRLYISLSSIITGTGGAINDLPQEVGDIKAYTRFGFGRRSSLEKKQVINKR